MPRPRPSLVAREDVLASEEEASDDAPSGRIGMTVGIEGEMLAWDEDKDGDEVERVREDAMIDMVVVIGVSDGGMLEAELGSDCEVGIHLEGFTMLPSIVSAWVPVHVGGVGGVVSDADATPGNISEGLASVDTISGETSRPGDVTRADAASRRVTACATRLLASAAADWITFCFPYSPFHRGSVQASLETDPGTTSGCSRDEVDKVHNALPEQVYPGGQQDDTADFTSHT
ncbi:hypothetical protein KVR01_000984 [Diaporthe batatas]|uniref:uncharacterized protein n=1 Tax=Diaporthe batatas TaxID=748121 RepID=UPI001D044BC1|nr:uncharacterized protein KVR01_000984 [Diaporthe batatas]KAG8170239.1 hypothetical protein KVR01_000984 [Diaporthe batatas]